jgi:Flp pilus assembly protein TadD
MEITIQQAVKAHQEGRLEEAEQLCRTILESQPSDLDVYNNLGVARS